MMVITAGDEGVERAALRAARSVGIRTAGMSVSPSIHAQMQFGLAPVNSLAPADADEMNVLGSGGCLCLGQPNKRTCSIKQLCATSGKPYYQLTDFQQRNAPAMLRLWVQRNKVQKLLVCGQTEKQAPGIGLAVEYFLQEVLPLCRPSV